MRISFFILLIIAGFGLATCSETKPPYDPALVTMKESVQVINEAESQLKTDETNVEASIKVKEADLAVATDDSTKQEIKEDLKVLRKKHEGIIDNSNKIKALKQQVVEKSVEKSVENSALLLKQAEVKEKTPWERIQDFFVDIAKWLMVGLVVMFIGGMVWLYKKFN